LKYRSFRKKPSGGHPPIGYRDKKAHHGGDQQ
jgi:hypothetical protein